MRRIVEELAEVRARETQLRLDLGEETRRTWPSPTPDSQDRRHRIEEESRQLAQRRDALVERRGALATELDRCREQLRAFEGGADSHPQIALPPVPSYPPGATNTTDTALRRILALAGGAVAVVLLVGGGVMAGIWYMQDNTKESRQDARATPSPSLTFSEEPSEEESASPSLPPPEETPSFVPPPGRTWSLISDLAPMEDNDPWNYETGKARINAEDHLRTLLGNKGEASATWQLDRQYASLVTRLGVTDESATGDSVVFTIKVDDQPPREIAMGPGQAPESVTVDLTGSFRVTLRVENARIGQTLGIGAWIDPVLTK
ncbi:NPCBM/NEW2 domain-containing protein [Streptomyces anulatus]|uniref:NPCBM/NEW2 domain-containing protein n=1 Tax=Streptomyces anulatus TaxID=1892 RepID=UPI0016766E6E|nr:NPCBM/NEW2 domain-containing protein [Streptomyces anulatus]GGY58497.1 hypothetical protein GCM10010342_52790 [Streptomyces anulatus]